MLRCLVATFLLSMQFISMGVAQPILINDATQRMFESSELSVLKTTTDISIDSAIKASFSPSNAEIPNLGSTKGEVWVKFSLTNKGRRTDNLLKVANPN